MFKTVKDPIVSVIQELFKLLKIQITTSSIEGKLLQHPAYPSLYAITNSLTNLKIPNKAVKITDEQLEQLETPFLATTKFNETVLVKSVESKYITYFSHQKGLVKSGIEEFLGLWNNMVVLVDTTIKAKEENYSQKRNFELIKSLRFPILLIFSIVLISVFIFTFKNSLLSYYFFTKIIGLLVSLLLVKKEINKNTEYSFCKVGSKINCDDVLNSSAARIFSWLSVTDLVFVYFAGTSLVMVLLLIIDKTFFASLLSSVILFSFLIIPLTLLSLFYQGFMLKKWCTLCLAITAIIWLESGLGYFHLNESILTHLGIKGGTIFILCLSFISTVWMFFKTTLRNSQNYNLLKNDYYRLTNNLEVFKHIQSEQDVFDMDFQRSEIIIGDELANNSIIIALNPYCPACAKEYKSLIELLNEYPNFAKIIIRFVGNVLNPDKEKMITSAMLISHYLESPKLFKSLLMEWFEIKNFNSFVKKHPIQHNKFSQQILQHHYEWSDKVNIEITPSSFLNSKKLPQEYTLERIIDILQMSENRTTFKVS